jgi:hypothetical protein
MSNKKSGKKKCRNIFSIYIKAESVIKLGANITGGLTTSAPLQSIIAFPIFQSTIECPQYTDVEGCTQLGSLELHIKDIPTLFLSIYYNTPTWFVDVWIKIFLTFNTVSISGNSNFTYKTHLKRYASFV